MADRGHGVDGDARLGVPVGGGPGFGDGVGRGVDSGDGPGDGHDPVEDGSGDGLAELVDRVPTGWSRHDVDGRAWGLTRVDHAGGRSSTIEGEELGGARRMSANVWRTTSGTHLKPCEMPAEQVLAVLRALPPRD